MRFLFTALLLAFSFQLAAQDNPSQNPQPAPLQPDATELRINDLMQCANNEKGLASWELFLIGDDDAAKLNFISVLDTIADNPAAQVVRYHRVDQNGHVIRQASFQFSFETYNMYKKMAADRADQAWLDKLHNEFAIRSLFKTLLATPDLTLICKQHMLERSMAPSSGVVGSN